MKQKILCRSAICFTALVSASPTFAQWHDNIEFSGLIEAELIVYNGYDKASDLEDLTIATGEFGFVFKTDKDLAANLVLLYEEDDTPFDVDQAFIDWSVRETVLVTFGQTYLPFGAYNSNLINDPLTLELGERLETALMATFNANTLSVSGYMFNGEVSEITDEGDTFNSLGFRIMVETKQFTVGFDYTNNIMDADNLQAATGTRVADLAGGYSLFASASLPQIFIIGELLATSDPVIGTNEPSALHLEAIVGEPDVNYTFALHQADELAFLGLPKTRLSLGYSRALAQNISIAAELFFDDDYTVDEGGTDESATGVLFQFGLVL